MTSLCRPLRRLHRNRRGGILTLTAILLPVLIGVAALSVDLGMLYLSKTKADLAAVTAAEAASQRLPDIADAEALAHQVALAMLDDAGFISSYEIEVAANSTEVNVLVHLEINTTLARLVGVDQLESYGLARRALP